MKITMVDLKSEYLEIRQELENASNTVFDQSQFINGEQVHSFSNRLKKYLEIDNVIPCGNGTDALQIALMSCEFEPEAEVIVPAHTYVSTAEVIALLGLRPVLVDVDPNTFNIDPNQVSECITKKTKAIIPVHLYGQCAEMEKLLSIAKENSLIVIEDAAQSFGSEFIFSSGEKAKSGTLGDMGTTSFFPTKTLGCYGDGGAIFTANPEFGQKCKLIANHGQMQKYYHEVVGVNSRLDTLQAAYLMIKLDHLEDFIGRRQKIACWYDESLSQIAQIQVPFRAKYSTHVFHQYTIKVKSKHRDLIRNHLAENDIPTVVYYPLPLHRQKAYKAWGDGLKFPNADLVSETVLSLPIHTHMTREMVNFIAEKISSYFKNE